MKIAVVTNDNQSISAHFGRARNYLVVTVEDGAIVAQENRDKAACDHGHHGHGHGHHDHDHHDHHAQASNVTLSDEIPVVEPVKDNHHTAATLIADCEAVLSRGMGRGMHANLKQAGVRPVLTTIVSVDEALAAYLAGTLQEHPELAH
jgi:predicted Fe-Mo cluster-binding NifX family protein